MASKYIFQLRRGWKWDVDPETEQPRNDWAQYEKQEGCIAPLEGELVLEYDNGLPRLKIGDGTSEFSELPYMSVDSFILPKPIFVTLYADKWEQAEDERYYQKVDVSNAIVTANSKVDLQPSPEQLVIFHDKDLAFVAENDNGVISVFCIGQVPTNDYMVQATVTEVIWDGKIIGDTTATPNPRPDWSQTDETKADYIMNKPVLGALATKDVVEKTDLSAEVQALLGQSGGDSQTFTETDPTVPDWAKAETKPSYTAEEVGALSASTLPTAIDTALEQAKADGSFNGKSAYELAKDQGYDGTEEEWIASLKGEDGCTPVKGTDYWTDADKQEIVDAVLANFINASEVAM